MQGEYRPFERPPAKPGLVAQIALGVFIGTLASQFVVWGAAELRIRWELHQAQAEIQRQIEATDRHLQQQRRADTERQLAEQSRQQLERQRQAEADRAVNERKLQAIEAATRKEAAWARFYKPSPGCALAGQSIDCSNEFIRAKRAFESEYRPATP